MPKFIETVEDELMFLHAWLNPATLERMKVSFDQTAEGIRRANVLTGQSGKARLEKNNSVLIGTRSTLAESFR